MNDISKLRKQVDEIDDQIIDSLAKRMIICKNIGAEKKKHGKPIKDTSREERVYLRIREKAANLGLNASQIETLYREIVNICSAVQE